MADPKPIVDLWRYFDCRNTCRELARTLQHWDLHTMRREATRRGNDAEIRLFEACITMARTAPPPDKAAE